MGSHDPVGHSTSDLRGQVRLKVPAPIPCSFSRGGIRSWWPGSRTGLVLDLSLKGAKVLADSAIHPGERLSLHMKLPSQALEMRVRVATVRWERDRVYGLEFVALSPVAEQRLRMFVAALGGGSAEPTAR